MDLEGEVAVVIGDVAMGATTEEASDSTRDAGQ
jgi:2-keto-4-pentenoate hydratase/2-oxohepta-3-ene-1,7-dioic acid hydratase in catechol pathway